MENKIGQSRNVNTEIMGENVKEKCIENELKVDEYKEIEEIK